MSRSSWIAACALALASSPIWAGPVTPQYDQFGHLDVTFGGSGIPNDAVAYSYTKNDVGQNDGGLTLAMAATQRYDMPTVTSDGAGTYFAGIGEYPGKAGYAQWNFDFEVLGDRIDQYTYKLFFDFDPADDNDLNTLGAVSLLEFNSGDPWQRNSWNLGMTFLPDGTRTGVTPPNGVTSFSPTAVGSYSFALVAYDANAREALRTAIRVNVQDPNAAVPEPGTIALVGCALFGLFAARRRKH